MTAHLLPPALWEQIAAFLSAGNTGQIEISVTSGRITGYKVIGSWRVTTIEGGPRIVELTEAARRVQSARQE